MIDITELIISDSSLKNIHPLWSIFTLDQEAHIFLLPLLPPWTILHRVTTDILKMQSMPLSLLKPLLFHVNIWLTSNSAQGLQRRERSCFSWITPPNPPMPTLFADVLWAHWLSVGFLSFTSPWYDGACVLTEISSWKSLLPGEITDVSPSFVS